MTPDTGPTEPSDASRSDASRSDASRSDASRSDASRSDASPSDAPRRRAGRLQRSVELALWVVVLGLVVWRFGPQAGAALGLRAGTEPAPDFVVQTLAGDSVRLSELRGNVVLINFWATWCPPCRIEMPGFQRVWEDYADRGLVIVGLSVDRGVRSDVARWVDDRGLTFPVAFAPGSVVRSYGGASVLPTSILVDPQGRIAHRVQGYYAEPALRAAVRRLLP